MSKTMTPKEKANELVDKFIQTNGNAFFAKECALITVDEILEIASQNKLVYHYTEDGVTILEQWPERVFWWWVKQEIEKL